MRSSLLLGPDHPLTRAESRWRERRTQLGVTVGFGVAAQLLAPVLGAPASDLAIGAAVVAALLLAAALLAHWSLRERALELIESGREELPLPVVAHVRSRLRDRRYRIRLARAIDAVAGQADVRPHWSAITAADATAVRALKGELLEIATLLRDLPSVPARGVALVQRLLSDGARSPLYLGPPLRLQEELGRIRHVLVQA